MQYRMHGVLPEQLPPDCTWVEPYSWGGDDESDPNEPALAPFPGDDAVRSDGDEDLRTRADSYRAKPALPKPRPSYPRQPRELEIETLTCTNCGREFQRTRTRGRKPTRCLDCRADEGSK